MTSPSPPSSGESLDGSDLAEIVDRYIGLVTHSAETERAVEEFS